MHEAIRSVRELEAQNAELTARLRLADEQSRSLKSPQEENARLKGEASGAHERVVLLEEEIRWLKAQVFGRTADALTQLLVGPNGAYTGKLLTDGLELYDSVTERLHLEHFGCLVHCRRYFDKASKVTELPSGRSLAKVAMVEYLGPVFAIEREIDALRAGAERDGMPAPLEQILALRQQHSAPVMAAFKDWVDARALEVPPKSALGKALSYTLGQWHKLSRFLTDPQLPAHNNVCENEIRPFAVGRRSWLFQGNGMGATASANWLSLIATAKANGLEPYAYLLNIIEALPKARTLEILEALLPWNVKFATNMESRRAG